MHYNDIMRQWIGLSHNGQPLYNVTDVVLVVQHTGHDQISNTYSTQVSFITTVLILATSFKEQLILAILRNNNQNIQFSRMHVLNKLLKLLFDQILRCTRLRHNKINGARRGGMGGAIVQNLIIGRKVMRHA